MKNWMSLTAGAMIALAPVSVMAETYLCEMGSSSGHDSFLIPPQTILSTTRRLAKLRFMMG